jgi:hypothetical protein
MRHCYASNVSPRAHPHRSPRQMLKGSEQILIEDPAGSDPMTAHPSGGGAVLGMTVQRCRSVGSKFGPAGQLVVQQLTKAINPRNEYIVQLFSKGRPHRVPIIQR